MRIAHLLAVLLAMPLGCGDARAEQADASFNAIALRGGGEVVVRHGPRHRVTLHEGDARHSSIQVAGNRLLIDNCRRRCPRGYHLLVMVETPGIAALSVADGGIIRAVGHIPARASFAARVEQGGAIDLRTLALVDLSARIMHGGMILARPSARLDALVEQGGRIAYWGSPRVTSSIRLGGVVERGAAADANRPLDELNPPLPPLPPLPLLDRID